MAKEIQDAELRKHIEYIQTLTQNMGADNAFMSIYRAEEIMQAKQQQRKEDISQIEATVKESERALRNARLACTRPNDVPSAAQHAQYLNKLDKERNSLIKAINDAESELASKEAELGQLKEQARTLEETDPAQEHEAELGGDPLRLAVFKAMGFEPIVGEDGKPRKMLVRSPTGEVYCVDIADDQSDFDTTQLLWKLAGSGSGA